MIVPVTAKFPEEVIAPQPTVPIPVIFPLELRTNALDAAAVPAVTLSKTPISEVVIVVLSSVKDVSPVIVPVTSKFPALLSVIFAVAEAAAVSETPVVNTNFVGFALDVNVFSEIAWIPAATVAASVPSESPAANSNDPITSFAVIASSSDFNWNTTGVLSDVIVFVNVNPLLWTCVNVISSFAPNFIIDESEVKDKVEPSKVKLDSAFIASVPVAVNILLFEPFVIKSLTSTDIASAATSIPVPAPIAKVLFSAIVPPPVNPLPAITLTELWSICSFATKFAKLSWSIVPCVAVDIVAAKLPPATVSVLLLCVNVTSPLLKFITEPLAKNKSDHIRDVVPSATPSLVTGANAFAAIFISSTLATLKIISSSVVAKSIKFCESLPIFKPTFNNDVIVVCAAVIAISLAFAVIPSPPTTFNVLFAAIVPPPVNPSPANTLTELWSICSFATKFSKLSWSIVPCVAVNTVPVRLPDTDVVVKIPVEGL